MSLSQHNVLWCDCITFDSYRTEINTKSYIILPSIDFISHKTVVGKIYGFGWVLSFPALCGFSSFISQCTVHSVLIVMWRALEIEWWFENQKILWNRFVRIRLWEPWIGDSFFSSFREQFEFFFRVRCDLMFARPLFFICECYSMERHIE